MEAMSHFSIMVYPNPVVDNQFRILVNGLQPEQEVGIALIDLMGNSVLTSIQQADLQGQIHNPMTVPNTLPTGMYILIVNDGKRSFNQKVLIR